MKLENATPAQRKAITTDDVDVLVLAGPGSGKTATSVARIEFLLDQGVQAERMLAITFTNAAAGELARRIPKETRSDDKEKKETPIKLGHTGTLHSFALRMLKELGAPFGYGDKVAVISPESAADLIESKARTIGCKRPLKELLKLKAAGRPPRSTRLDLASTVIATYFDELKEAGIVDYDVLLTEFRDMLAVPEIREEIRKRFDFLFVDEVQDSSPVDWEIYRALPIASKFYVGDPDQAIYSFRGGRVTEMLEHARRELTTVIKLEANFRSRAEICAGANALIRRNVARIPKDTISNVGDGGKIFSAPVGENAGYEMGAVARTIKAICGSESEKDGAVPSIAILTRTNAVADAYRKTLAACSIPVVERTVSELPRDWSHARAFVELLVEPSNDALAFFYLIGLYEKKGATPRDAREAAHAVRRSAASVGKSINAQNLHFGRISSPEVALQALAEQGVSREAQAMIVDRYRELPPGASMLDLALSIGELHEYTKDGEGDGVRVLTVHGAKGREFDVVFVVGFEDEVFPGRAAKILDADERAAAIEEERRLAYVAITRARTKLYLSSCASREVVYGKHREISKRTPSRFIAEILEAWKDAPVVAEAAS